MSMSKQDFIALADQLRIELRHNPVLSGLDSAEQAALVRFLCDFCRSQNSRFDASRWTGYLQGTCGPNGGAVKKSA